MENKKSLWQFFTPKYISDFMIGLFNDNFPNTKKNINIFEPSFWEGVFIKWLINHFRKKNNKVNITGTEIDKILFDKFLNDINLNYDISVNLYNSDFFDIIKKHKINNEKFDLIIWNPPYLKNNKIDTSVTKKIKATTKYQWSWNLYYYFIRESIDLLEVNWLLVFITPITFLTNTYAKELRNYLFQNGVFLNIYSLEEKKVFKDADVETVIFVYKKMKRSENRIKHNVRMGIIKDKFNINGNKINEKDFNIITIDHFDVKDKRWTIHDKFINSEKKDNYNKNEKKIKIKDLFNVSVWMVSWYDKAFDVDREKDLLGKLNNIEKGYIINFVKADTLYKKEFVPHNYIFIPKWQYQEEKEIKEECPNLYNYLLNYKGKLKDRYWSKTLKWWEWATVRNKKIFEENDEFFYIPSITRKEVSFQYVKNKKIKKIPKYLYSGGNIITLTFKSSIKRGDKDEYIKILNSSSFIEKINKIVPKKGWRKLFSQSFILDIDI